VNQSASSNRLFIPIFLDWVDEGIKVHLTDPTKLLKVLTQHHYARNFGAVKAAAANRD
jgi:hypothetical protein